MATVEELGKRVKAKYAGSYDDMSDRDLGVRVKSKFPGSYDDFEDAALNVSAPIVKPVSTPSKDFNRAISLPGVTNPEKTKLEKAISFATEPIVNNIAVEGGAPNIGSLELGNGSWKTEPVTKRVGDVLEEKGGGPVTGVMRGAGRIAAGLTSPANLALAGGIGVLPKLGRAAAGAVFTAEQASQLPEQVRQVKSVFDAPDATSGDKVQAVTELGATTALGALGAKGTLHDFRTSPQVQGHMAPKIARDFDAAESIAYDLAKDRRTRGAGAEMMDSAVDGTSERMAKYGLVDLPPKIERVGNEQGGTISAAPTKPPLAEQSKATKDRIDAVNEEVAKFAAPPEIPSRELPPRQFKSAEESAAVFQSQPNVAERVLREQLTRRQEETHQARVATAQAAKAAAEAAAVKQRSLIEERRRRRAEQEVTVPETGPSEHEMRVADARDRIAKQYFEKPFSELAENDRADVDSLVSNGEGFAVTAEEISARTPKHEAPAPLPEPVAALPPQPAKPTPQELRQKRIQEENDAIEWARLDFKTKPLPKAELTPEGSVREVRPPSFREAQEARRAEKLPPPEPSLMDQVVDATDRSLPAPSVKKVKSQEAASILGLEAPPLPPLTSSNAAIPPQTPPSSGPVAAAPVKSKPAAIATKTLGLNPESTIDSSIAGNIASSNRKRQAKGVKALAAKGEESGIWKPFSGDKSQLSQSEQYVVEMTERREAARRAMSKGKNRLTPVQSLWVNGKANLVDSMSPAEDPINAIHKANSGYSILPSQEAEVAIAKAQRAPTLAGQFAKDKGLTKIIKDLPSQQDVDNLDQLLIARHSAELDPKISTGRDAVKDSQLVKDLTPRYQKELDGIRQYVGDLMDYIVDSGLKTREQMDALRKRYPDYADFHRVLPEAMTGFQNTRATASKSSTNVIQKLIGSDKLEIDSPLGNLLEKTHQVFQEGQQNQAARALAEQSKFPGMDKVLRPISDKQAKSLDPSRYFTYLDNGKPRHMMAPPEFVAAAKSLNVESIGLLGKVLLAPVRVFKAGTTAFDIVFALSNAARDQFTRFVNQPGATKVAQKIIPAPQSASAHIAAASAAPLDLAKATTQAVVEVFRNYATKNSPLYDEMVRNAGGGTSFDLFRNQPVLSVRDIRAQKNPVTRTKNIFRGGLREIENAIGMSEEVTRLQSYQIAKADALRNGLSEVDAQAVAGKAARQSTADFYRGGNWKRAMMAIYPYANASIQGTRATIRHANTPAGAAAVAARAAMAVAIPTAIATIWNTSSPERKKAWDDIQDWEKDKSFIILPDNPVKDARGRWNAYKLPMAPGVSEVGGLVRKHLEAQTGGDPVTAAAYAEALFNFLSPVSGTGDQIVGQMVPQGVKAPVEAVFNKNFYMNKPVEPAWMEKLPLQDRAFESTSGTARMIGQAVGAPPVRVDHVLKGIGGGVTSQALHYIDSARKGIADKLPDKMPGVQYLRDLPVGGEGTGDKIQRRFAVAQGGAIDDRDMAETQKAALKVSEEDAPGRRLAMKFFKEWQQNPEATFDRIDVAIESGELDEKSATSLEKMIKAEMMKLQRWEKDLLHQSSAVRAERVLAMINGKSEEEIDRIVADLESKGILTEAVVQAIEAKNAADKK